MSWGKIDWTREILFILSVHQDGLRTECLHSHTSISNALSCRHLKK